MNKQMLEILPDLFFPSFPGGVEGTDNPQCWKNSASSAYIAVLCNGGSINKEKKPTTLRIWLSGQYLSLFPYSGIQSNTSRNG